MQQIGSRAKRLPPPPWVVYEVLTVPNADPSRPWLHLLGDETPPVVLATSPNILVVWSSMWLDRPAAQIQFDLVPSGVETELRWTLLDEDDAGPSPGGHMCERLQQLINAELRYSFGR